MFIKYIINYINNKYYKYQYLDSSSNIKFASTNVLLNFSFKMKLSFKMSSELMELGFLELQAYVVQYKLVQLHTWSRWGFCATAVIREIKKLITK